MMEYLLEAFLAQYYLLEAICGDFLTASRRRDMYDELAQVFCIGQTQQLEELYTLSCQPEFAQLRSLSAYQRLQRTMEFAQREGHSLEITAGDRMVLAQKREALSAKAEIFKQEKSLTAEGVYAGLLNQAMNGNINAMAVLAYMEYHGLCIPQDRESAMKRIRLCARWNHLAGNLMGIAYDDRTQCYYDTLFSVLRSVSQRQVFFEICVQTRFDGSAKLDPAARILEKAFGMGIVKRSSYDQVFARVAFSRIIGAEDKEKLLLNKQSEAIAALSDIPFDVSVEGRLEFAQDCLQRLPLLRPQEHKRILQNLAVARDCPAGAYTPLLIACQDEYLSRMYYQALKTGFSAGALVQVDAATLTPQDFLPGRENVLLRGLSQTRSAKTVFLIEHCEELEGVCLEEMMKLLDHDYRKQFKLFQPSVCLDLSGLVFVLLASRRSRTVNSLSQVCDCMWAEPISQEEKGAVVDSIFVSRAQLFGCQVKLEPGCREHLVAFAPGRVQGIIDGALRCAMYEKSKCISLEDLQTVSKEYSACSPRREFGYTGGDQNA